MTPAEYRSIVNEANVRVLSTGALLQEDRWAGKQLDSCIAGSESSVRALRYRKLIRAELELRRIGDLKARGVMLARTY